MYEFSNCTLADRVKLELVLPQHLPLNQTRYS